MAAAVASRHSANTSPHLSGRSMPSSPRSTRNSVHAADSQKKDAPTGTEVNQEPAVPTINPPEEVRDTAAPTTNAPLAPPPKPTQNGDNHDFFGPAHGHSHFSKEPNPFENAFGGNPADTSGKTQLPGVTSLTSPAPLLPGNTPGWPGSLRSGPLSPAMLPGPTGPNDYFNSDHHFAGSFPTPNESSLRTGLTPGGGGSMFPQPSPNSQALFHQLQSGGATPGTLDFHRTAMTARAQNHNYGLGPNGATSQPSSNPNIQPDLDSKPYHSHPLSQQQDSQDPFSSHQTNDAANGLFMLAQAGGQQQQQAQQQRNGGFAMPQSQQHQHQPQQHAQQSYQQNIQQSTSNADKRGKNSIGSTMSGSTDPQQGEYSDGSVETKPQTRGRGKKGSSAKSATNGKRKTEDTPSKPGGKKQRNNNGQAHAMEEPEEDDTMMDDQDQDETGPDGKKMTDEEKRKNFLERNRVAALKCRQRKKQWLANLQQKVEIFSTENDALAATVTQLREEIVGLKTLLLAHKECPVSQAQGISGNAMQQIAGDMHQYANPYGMAMGPGGGMGQQQGPMQQQAGMQRR